jgi:hypothetical protein
MNIYFPIESNVCNKWDVIGQNKLNKLFKIFTKG